MGMEGDTEDSSVDEEFEESLPLSVQGNLTKLRSDKFNLSTSNKTLRRQLGVSRLWTQELEARVSELREKVADLEAQLTAENSHRQRLQVQLDEVGERLDSGQISFSGDIHNHCVTTHEPDMVSVETQTEGKEEGELSLSQEDWPESGDIVEQAWFNILPNAPRSGVR